MLDVLASFGIDTQDTNNSELSQKRFNRSIKFKHKQFTAIDCSRIFIVIK